MSRSAHLRARLASWSSGVKRGNTNSNPAKPARPDSPSQWDLDKYSSSSQQAGGAYSDSNTTPRSSPRKPGNDLGSNSRDSHPLESTETRASLRPSRALNFDTRALNGRAENASEQKKASADSSARTSVGSLYNPEQAFALELPKRPKPFATLRRR
ncbi:hypothetical protein JCM3765_007461 [Sporobolomyces pararoseus]